MNAPISTITPQCVVSLTWTLSDTLGEVLDQLDDPVEFYVGGDLLPKMDEALQGHRAGDTLDLHLEPEDAFGDFIDKLVFLEPRKLFAKAIAVGDTLQGLPAGSNPDAPAGMLYTVTDVYPDHVVVDANHPLAGIALRLKLTVNAMRQATEAEVGSGTCGVGFFKLGGAFVGTTLADDEEAGDDVAGLDASHFRSKILH